MEGEHTYLQCSGGRWRFSCQRHLTVIESDKNVPFSFHLEEHKVSHLNMKNWLNRYWTNYNATKWSPISLIPKWWRWNLGGCKSNEQYVLFCDFKCSTSIENYCKGPGGIDYQIFEKASFRMFKKGSSGNTLTLKFYKNAGVQSRSYFFVFFFTLHNNTENFHSIMKTLYYVTVLDCVLLE